MSINTEIKPLIQGFQHKEPRLYELLVRIADKLEEQDSILNPLVALVTKQIAEESTVLPPTSITSIISLTNIQINWVKPDVNALSYEIRESAILTGVPGVLDWDTANFITRTPSNQINLAPETAGIHRYLFKSLDGDGKYSIDFGFHDLTIEIPKAVVVTSEVIDNNVLLKWLPPASSHKIEGYDVYKGAVLIGSVSSTFVMFFETIAGDYVYKVVPFDIVGNRGLGAEITVHVNQPPDYVLTDSFLSTFAGAKVNTILEV